MFLSTVVEDPSKRQVAFRCEYVICLSVSYRLLINRGRRWFPLLYVSTGKKLYLFKPSCSDICSDLDYAAGMLISLRLSASKWTCWYREMLFLNSLKRKKKLTVILSLSWKIIEHIDSGRSRQFFANNFSRTTNFASDIQFMRNRIFVTSRVFLLCFTVNVSALA